MMNDPLLVSDQERQQRPSYSSSLLIHRLYLGHFLARWGARMWEFSVGLYMINVWPDSFLLPAIYGVVESASTAIFGPYTGHWVDKLSYIKVLRLWLLCQNVSFMIAGGAVIAILVITDLISRNFTAFSSLVVLINISGAFGVLSTLAGTILIEREWVVVISSEEEGRTLTEMNSTIRRIDLSCKLLAPVVSGFIISFVSLTASAVTLALWNVLSVLLQYWLLMSVYNGIPSLKETDQRRISRSHENIVKSAIISSSSSDSLTDADQTRSNETIPEKLKNLPYISAWRSYVRQDVVLPGLALALLYFSVLSFGTLMTATLEWQGIPAYIIGIARGISAIVGIGATFVYPLLESRVSTLRTGLWSIWSQWTCLLLCVASIFMKKKKALAAYMLMSGVASSRLGLWMFDLSVIQQMQDHVPESDRCVVGGVQNSLQSFLDLMTYIMGIIISNPQDFWKLIILSSVLVTLAAVLYSLYVFRVRKHLIHFEKIVMLFSWSAGSF